MKHLFIFVCIIAFLPLHALTQSPSFTRILPLRHIENDSVVASYNENYYLIEDSCASIIRKAHLNIRTWKFTGTFEDVSKANPRQIVGKGTYDSAGCKDGDFVTWYLNGKMQARGNYKHNRFNDVWDFYYPSGKPKLTFEVNSNDIKIINAWDDDARKMVKNGEGIYDLNLGAIVWRGRITNGKPDGKWIAGLTTNLTPAILATEVFVNGVFQKGSNATGVYNDSSRINFLQAVSLPLINAEHLVMAFPCNTQNANRFVSATYPQGQKKFIADVSERLTPLLNLLDATAFSQPVELRCRIIEDGTMVSNPMQGVDNKTMLALKAALHDFPKFTPATHNGRAIQQDIVITITYKRKRYSFSSNFRSWYHSF